MPLYEYRCESCRKEFEAYRRLSDDREETCPACGGRSSRVSISLFRSFGGGTSSGGTSCGSGPRRSPFR